MDSSLKRNIVGCHVYNSLYVQMVFTLLKMAGPIFCLFFILKPSFIYSKENDIQNIIHWFVNHDSLFVPTYQCINLFFLTLPQEFKYLHHIWLVLKALHIERLESQLKVGNGGLWKNYNSFPGW